MSSIQVHIFNSAHTAVCRLPRMRKQCNPKKELKMAKDSDNSLYPIAVLIDELRNDDVQVCNRGGWGRSGIELSVGKGVCPQLKPQGAEVQRTSSCC